MVIVEDGALYQNNYVYPTIRYKVFDRGDHTHFINQHSDHQKGPCMVIADLVADVVLMLATFVLTFKKSPFFG